MINTRDLHTFIEEFPLKTEGPHPTIFGTCVVTYEIKRYTDLRNLGDSLKYRVLCTQRIIIPNASQFALGPQDISGFNEYPAAVSNTITVKNTSDGLAADLLNYAPRTVNAAVMTSNSNSTANTQSNSIQHSSGSSTSQSNSFGASANLGFFGYIPVGGASVSHDHTSASGRYSGSATGAQSGGETQSQDSTSMSIKDWGCYSYLDPSNSSPTWVWGQEYPWNVIQYNNASTENPSSSDAILLPNFVQALLCDANQALPPSQLSLFGIDFTMKALWDTTPDSSGGITVTHTINYSTATHTFLSANTVTATIATPVSASYTSPNIDLVTYGLDAVRLSQNYAAIIAFIPKKFLIPPTPVSSSGSGAVNFKIVSPNNDLLVSDTTDYSRMALGPADTGAGFTSLKTGLVGTFTQKCNALQVTATFKIVDTANDYTLYFKHWKVGATGFKLQLAFNGDTSNTIVKYVDSREGEGADDNQMAVSLRNQDYGSVDCFDLLQLGLNTVQINIIPIGESDACSYQVRAISLVRG